MMQFIFKFLKSEQEAEIYDELGDTNQQPSSDVAISITVEKQPQMPIDIGQINNNNGKNSRIKCKGVVIIVSFIYIYYLLCQIISFQS